jgi:nitrate/TMAO reductase-like tetraheme cytochrome c subunit
MSPAGGGWWSRLWRQPRSRWLLGVPLGGVLAFVVGILAWVALHASLAASDTLAFCTSCHEMESTVYQEYKETVHYRNAAGVRAVCADCHVPHSLGPKLIRKTQASFNELPKHFLGYIDTREKFQMHRPEMAMDVWRTMRANDSRECRNCHSYEAMARDLQDRSASKKHSPEWRERFGDTCIDCHFGIAHDLPEGVTPEDLEEKTS